MLITKNDKIDDIHYSVLCQETVTAISHGEEVSIVLDDHISISDIRDTDYRCAFYADHKRYNLGDDDAESRIKEALEDELNTKLLKRFPSVDCRSTCRDEYLQLGNGKEIVNPYYLEDDMTDIYRQIQSGELPITQTVIAPIYCYEHGDITLSTSPFSCRWDSGIVGVMAVNIADLAKWGHSRNVEYLTPKLKDIAFKAIQSEVDEIESVLRQEHLLILRDDSAEMCHKDRLMDCLY